MTCVLSLRWCHQECQVRKRRFYACQAINIVVFLDLLWFLLSGRVPVWFSILFILFLVYIVVMVFQKPTDKFIY